MRRNVSLVALSVLAACFALEMLLRGLGWSAIEPHRRAPYVGWEPIPGIEGTYRRESVAHVEFDEHGFRGPPFAEGARILAVTGDSFVEARELPWQQTFTGLMDAALPGIRVVNAGVSGWGTGQAWLDWRRRVRHHSPETVVHVLYLGNDVVNNHLVLDGHKDRPFFRRGEDGTLYPDKGWPPELDPDSAGDADDFSFHNALRIVQFLETHIDLAQRGERPDQWQRTAANPAREHALFAPPAPGSDWQEAWRLTEALIHAYHQDVTSAGAEFVLAVAGMPVQVHPDPAVRGAVAERVGADGLDYPLERLRAFAGARGIRFVDLVSPLRDEGQRSGVFFHGFPRTAPGYGHWNADGHRAVADVLIRALPLN